MLCGLILLWVMNFANFLEGNKIAACGHKAKEKGCLLKIYTSCQPEQTPKKFCFSTCGVELEGDNCLSFNIHKDLTLLLEKKLLCFHENDQKC